MVLGLRDTCRKSNGNTLSGVLTTITQVAGGGNSLQTNYKQTNFGFSVALET